MCIRDSPARAEELLALVRVFDTQPPAFPVSDVRADSFAEERHAEDDALIVALCKHLELQVRERPTPHLEQNLRHRQRARLHARREAPCKDYGLSLGHASVPP